MGAILGLLGSIAIPILKAIGLGALSGGAAYGATKALEATLEEKPQAATRDEPVKKNGDVFTPAVQKTFGERTEVQGSAKPSIASTAAPLPENPTISKAPLTPLAPV
jgi:hypothetical protein